MTTEVTAVAMVHPVSIARFPLRRFSPGAGLLRYVFFTLSTLTFSRGWVRKDGNLLRETGCKNTTISSIMISTSMTDNGNTTAATNTDNSNNTNYEYCDHYYYDHLPRNVSKTLSIFFLSLRGGDYCYYYYYHDHYLF